MSSKEVLIHVRNLSAGYNKIPVIENVSFELFQSQIFVIMGPNGAGKSTLLRSILGLVKILSGSISVLGYDIKNNIKKIRKFIGYVPQREHVSFNIPIKTKDVVLSGITLRKSPLYLPTKNDIKLVREVLEHVGLSKDTWFKQFNELSGGQQQKALIARALVSKPRILLLDEPFSAVDIKSLREIMELLHNLKKNEDMGIIIVTHDINEIIEYVDCVMLINKKMIACGDPLSVFTPENLKKTYGVDIKVIPYLDKCLAIIGDRHA